MPKRNKDGQTGLEKRVGEREGEGETKREEDRDCVADRRAYSAYFG